MVEDETKTTDDEIPLRTSDKKLLDVPKRSDELQKLHDVPEHHDELGKLQDVPEHHDVFEEHQDVPEHHDELGKLQDVPEHTGNSGLDYESNKEPLRYSNT
jgi:hypothetical protein